MLQVEIYNESDGFWFRLVAGDGRRTEKCTYKQIAMLDGHVCASEYYLPSYLAFKPITPEVLCTALCIGEEQPPRKFGSEE